MDRASLFNFAVISAMLSVPILLISTAAEAAVQRLGSSRHHLVGKV